MLLLGIYSVLDGDVKTVNCPPFAESITEGDIRWEKGKMMFFKVLQLLETVNKTLMKCFISVLLVKTSSVFSSY